MNKKSNCSLQEAPAPILPDSVAEAIDRVAYLARGEKIENAGAAAIVERLLARLAENSLSQQAAAYEVDAKMFDPIAGP